MWTLEELKNEYTKIIQKELEDGEKWIKSAKNKKEKNEYLETKKEYIELINEIKDGKSDSDLLSCNQSNIPYIMNLPGYIICKSNSVCEYAKIEHGITVCPGKDDICTKR